MLRRRQLMAMQKLNTTPKVVQYDKCWGRGIEIVDDVAGWCITEWYVFNPRPTDLPTCTINGYVGNDITSRTFQYYYINNQGVKVGDWYYFNNNNTPGSRLIGRNPSWQYISFSVDLALLDDAYAYVQESGQILFAGKNTIYYGHRNISELN